MSITKETLEQHLKDPAIFAADAKKVRLSVLPIWKIRPCSMIWLKRVCLRSAMTV